MPEVEARPIIDGDGVRLDIRDLGRPLLLMLNAEDGAVFKEETDIVS